MGSWSAPPLGHTATSILASSTALNIMKPAHVTLLKWRWSTLQWPDPNSRLHHRPKLHFSSYPKLWQLQCGQSREKSARPQQNVDDGAADTQIIHVHRLEKREPRHTTRPAEAQVIRHTTSAHDKSPRKFSGQQMFTPPNYFITFVVLFPTEEPKQQNQLQRIFTSVISYRSERHHPKASYEHHTHATMIVFPNPD